MSYLFRHNDSTRHVWKRDEGCIQHHPRQWILWGRKRGYHSRRGAAPVPSSDSVDSADAEYNSVKQLSITESSAESRASEARIPEPQFPSLLLSLCHTPPPLLSPLPSGKTEAPSHLRRAVKRFLPPERTLIRSPLPPRALCSVDPE